MTARPLSNAAHANRLVMKDPKEQGVPELVAVEDVD
jgi:hypothetical protein